MVASASASDIFFTIIGIVALNCVAGNYALGVKAREGLSPIDARALCDFFFYTMAISAAVVLGVVHLSLEDPPERAWWLFDAPLAAVPLATAWAWWSLGRWPIRRLTLPLVFGLPWDDRDMIELANRRRPPRN